MVDVWSNVRAERAALADDLDGVGEEQWETPSLCEGWTVRDTLAHLTGTAKTSAGGFLRGMLTSGFSLTRMQAKAIEEDRGDSGTDALARFRGVVDSTSAPPGPAITWLGEIVIHGEDIRRPLGLTHAHDTDVLVALADFFKGSNLIIGAKKRIAGLTLEATDADWQHGSGPSVSGPLLALVMAMTGRSAFCDDLTGDGVDTLRARCG